MSDTFNKESILSTVTDAMKLKKQMLAKCITSARVPCPQCEGFLHGRLAGRKNHIRMWCDGPCNRNIME